MSHGTPPLFLDGCSRNPVSARFAMAKVSKQHARDLLAMLVSFFVDCVPFCPGKPVSDAVQAFERKADCESSGISYTGFGDEAAAKRNLANQFTCQRSPTERPGNNG